MEARVEIGAAAQLETTLRDAVGRRRGLFVAGLPGSGKSLLVRRAAAVAHELGRPVHLLRWDVARLAFDTPEILARYPEVAGVTHPAIRLAVGRWARRAVGAWHEANPPGDLLIGETPLVGERLASVARPHDDAVEELLASDATLFLVPVPSAEVRAAIEAARERDVAATGDARDRASAAPDLVRWHWEDLVRVARELGVAAAEVGGYDPELYARTYRRLLRYRHAAVLRVTGVEDVRSPVPASSAEVVPTAAEVAAEMDGVRRWTARRIERAAADWYRY